MAIDNLQLNKLMEYERMFTRGSAPALTVSNLSEKPNSWQQDNMASHSPVFRRDKDALEAGFYDDDNEWAPTEEAFDGNMLSKSRGYLFSSGSVFEDKDGNSVTVPDMEVFDKNGNKIENPHSAQKYRYGNVKDILKELKFTNEHKQSFGDALSDGLPVIGNTTEIKSHYYPAFDKEHGWYYQEFIGTHEEFEKIKLNGHVIANQYGTKPLAENAILSGVKTFTNVLADIPRDLGNLVDGGASILHKIAGDDEDRAFGSYMDYYNQYNEHQGFLNKSSIRAGEEGVFSNNETFSGAIGSGLASLLEYGLGIRATTGIAKVASKASSKMAEAAMKAVGKKYVGKKAAQDVISNGEFLSHMMGVGTMINFKEGYDSGLQNGLSKEDSFALGISTGVVNAAVESMVGGNTLLKWLSGTNGAKQMAKLIVEKTAGQPARVAEEAVRKSLAKEIAARITKHNLVEFAKPMAEEAIEEYVQGTVLQSGQFLYDMLFSREDAKVGDGYFGTNPFTWEAVRENLEEGAIGGIIGALGSAGALRSNAKIDSNKSIAHMVLAGETNSLYKGAEYALNKGQITEDEYNSVREEIGRYDEVLRRNPEGFINVVTLPEHLHDDAAVSVLTKMNDFTELVDSVKEDGIDLSEDKGKDAFNAIEKAAIDTIAHTFISQETNENGEATDVEYALHSPNQRFIIKTLEDAGLTREANLVKAGFENANKTINKVDRVIRKVVNKLPEAEQEAAMDLLSNIAGVTIMKNSISNTFNKLRSETLNKELDEVLTFDDVNEKGVLRQIEANIKAKIAEITGSIVPVPMNPVQKQQLADYIEGIDVDDSIDATGKDNFVRLKKQQLSVDNIVTINNAEQNILLSEDKVDGILKEHRKQQQKANPTDNTSVVTEKSKPSVRQTKEKEVTKKPEEKKSPIEEKKEEGKVEDDTTNTEFFDSIRDRIQDGETELDLDGVTAKMERKKDGSYTSTISYNGKSQVTKGTLKNENDAQIAFFNSIKDFYNKEGHTIGRQSAPIEIIDAPITESEQKVDDGTVTLPIDGFVTSNANSHDNMTRAERQTHTYINNPRASDKELGNKASFDTNSVFGRNTNEKKAIATFQKGGTTSQVEMDNMIKYLPIRYTFESGAGTTEVQTRYIFLTSATDYTNGELTPSYYATRRAIITKMMESKNKSYTPDNVVIKRRAGKFNNVSKTKSQEERNSNLSKVPALGISKDSSGNYQFSLTDNFQGAAQISPVFIGYPDSQGLVHYNNTEIAVGLGNPGAPYLVIPSLLSMNRAPNRIVRLNPRKIDASDAEIVYDIMIAIASGKLGASSLVKDGDFGIKIGSNKKLTYKQLLEIIVPNGEITLQYVNNDVSDEYKEWLEQKKLYIDREGLLRYGHNKDTGYANIIDPLAVTDADKEAFVSWMSQNKNYSNSSHVEHDFNGIPNFTFGTIQYSGTNYSTFMIDNNIVQTDLSPDARTIYDMTSVDITIPGLLEGAPLVPESIVKSTKKSTPKNKVEQKAEPVKAPTKTVSADPTNPLSPGQYILMDSHPSDIIEWANNLPDNAVIHVLVNNKPGIIVDRNQLAAVGVAGIAKQMVSTTVNAAKLKASVQNAPNPVEADSNIKSFFGNYVGGGNVAIIGYTISPETETKDGSSKVSKYPQLDTTIEEYKGSIRYSQGDYHLIEKTVGDRTVFQIVNPTIQYHSKQYGDIDKALAGMKKVSGIDPTAIQEVKSVDDIVDKSANNPEHTTTIVEAPKATKEEVVEVSKKDFENTKQETTGMPSAEEVQKLRDAFKKHESEMDSDFNEDDIFREVDNIGRVSEVRKQSRNDIKVYRKMLSRLTGGKIKFTDRLISMFRHSGNVRYAWASMNIDGMTLYKGAEEGTAYHEAFHRVSLLYLTPAERLALYEQARIDYNLVGKDDAFVEEVLAEEFRKYMLGRPVSKKQNIISRVWNSLKNFVTQFVFGRKPSYNNLQTLFQAIESGGYAFVRPTKENIELFRKTNPNEDVAMSVDGVEYDNFMNSTEVYDTMRTMAVIAMNTNDFDSFAGKHQKEIDFTKVKQYVLRRAAILDKIVADPNTNSRLAMEQFAKMNEILDKFDSVFVPAIVEELESYGMTSKLSQELEEDLEEVSPLISSSRNDEMSASYNFSAKDNAAADVKLMFHGLRDGTTSDTTGFPNFVPFDQAWFSVFRLVHDAPTIDNMINRLREASEEAPKHDGINMYTELLRKLEGGNIDPHFRTRFWNTMKKHRHNMVNFLFGKLGGKNSYKMENADINRRSNQLSTLWSTMFGLNMVHDVSTKDSLERMQRIQQLWSDIKKSAIYASKDVDANIENFIELMSLIEIPIDRNTVILMMKDYDGGATLDQNEILSNQFRNMILNKNKFGEDLSFAFFFEKRLNPGYTDSFINKPVITKSDNSTISPEKYLSSNRFLRMISEYYVKANPSMDDDVILGPDGNLTYAFAEYNFLTQSVEEYLKSDEYIAKLKTTTYANNSMWLDAISGNPKVKDNMKINTVLNFLQSDAFDRGRAYSDVSAREDMVMKMTSILNGDAVIPVLANKKTYYTISGLPMLSGIVDIHGNIDSEAIDQFVRYARAEYQSILEAEAKLDEFIYNVNEQFSYVNTVQDALTDLGFGNLTEVRSLTDDQLLELKSKLEDVSDFTEFKKVLYQNQIIASHFGNNPSPISFSTFNSLSEAEQDALDYSDLTSGYHYGKGKDGAIKLGGDGTKFRHVKSLSELSRGDLEALLNDDDAIYEHISKSIKDNVIATIQKLADNGIISLNGEPGAIFGQTTDGKPLISHRDTLISDRFINQYIKTDEKGKRADKFNVSRALMDIASTYAVNSAMNVIEFEKLLSFDQAFYGGTLNQIKRYSALSSTGGVMAPDLGELSHIYNIGRSDDAQFTITNEQLTNYNTVTLKSNVLTNSPVYDSIYNRWIGKDDGALVRLYTKFASDPNVSTLYPRFEGGLEMVDDGSGTMVPKVVLMARNDAASRLKNYKKVDQTDAQTYITPDMFRRIQILQGNWNKTKEIAFRELSSNRNLTADEESQYMYDLTANILKMVHFGPMIEDGIAIPVYDKMSLAPIFKRFFEGEDLYNIIDSAEKNNIQMLKFDSAVKSGNRQALRLYDKESQSLLPNAIESLSSDKYKHSQEFKYLRMQLVTDPHDTSSTAAGSQFIKIGVSNIKADETYVYNGEGMSGADLLQHNINLINTLTERGWNEFSRELGATLTGEASKEALVDLLVKSGLQSGQSKNFVQSLGIDEHGEFTTELSILPNVKFIQSRILARMKKDIIDTKFPGGAFIQMSDFGIGNRNGHVGSHSSLKMFREDGTSEVKASMSMIKNFLPRIPFTDSDGNTSYRDMSYTEAREYVKNSDIKIIGYRIPTQGQNSTLALTLVDILPDSMGDAVVLPSEFTSLTGADFDIDKLFLLGYNYEIDTKNKTLNKIAYDNIQMRLFADEGDSKKTYTISTQQVQNALLDTYFAVLSSDHNILETTTPLDATTEPIKKVADKLQEYDSKHSNNTMDFENLFPAFQESVKSQNMGADKGIGPMALANVHHILTQMADLEFNMNVPMQNKKPNVMGEIGIGSLSRMYDKNGTLIQDWTSALINAHVDAAKDPYILRLNVNKYTYSAVALLIRSGYGEASFWLTAQPILVDLADKYNSIFNAKLGLTDAEIKMKQWKKPIINEWHKKLKAANTANGTMVEVPEINNPSFLASVQDSKFLEDLVFTEESNRDAEWYATQIAIMQLYEQVMEYGNALSDLIRVTQIDTGKYGKNAVEISQFSDKFDSVMDINETPYFYNARDIMDKTFLGKKKEYSLDKFSNLFGGSIIDMNPIFVDMAKTILNKASIYGYVDKNTIGVVNDALKHSMIAPFFTKLEGVRSIYNMFYGTDSTAIRLTKLRAEIDSDNSLADLRGNKMLELLTPNSVTADVSSVTAIPQMLNSFAMKINDANSMNIYTNSFRDILYHREERIRDFGRELVYYAYITSGGTSGGVNNFLNLVPLDYYGNLRSKDGLTLNEYAKRVRVGLTEDIDSDLKADLIDRIYRSLWTNDRIIPNVGIITASSNGKFIVSHEMNDVIMPTNQDANSWNFQKGISVPATIVMDPVKANYYRIPTTVLGQMDTYAPFVKMSTESGGHTILYKYQGVTIVQKDTGEVVQYPVYTYAEKLGYKDRQYTMYESRKKSVIPFNRIFNNSGETAVLPDVISKSTAFYAANPESLVDPVAVKADYADDSAMYSDNPMISSDESSNTSPANTTSSTNTIINTSLSIVLEYGKSVPEASDVYSYHNQFNEINGEEKIEADELNRSVENGNGTTMTVNITRMTPKTAPIGVLRNNISEIPTEATIQNVDRLAKMGHKIQILSADSLLAEKLAEAGIPYDMITDSDVPVIEITKTEAPVQQGVDSSIPGLKITVAKHTGYVTRTKDNAASADVTVAIATDFTTRGEELTKNSAAQYKKGYFPIEFAKMADPSTADAFVKYLNAIDAKSINIAGNGMYTLATIPNMTQDRVDNGVYILLQNVLSHPELKNKNISVRSGGQTGIDEAGIKAGMRLGLDTTMHVPADWVMRDANKQTIKGEEAFKARFEGVVQNKVVLDERVNTSEKPSTESDLLTRKKEMLDSLPSDMEFTKYSEYVNLIQQAKTISELAEIQKNLC